MSSLHREQNINIDGCKYRRGGTTAAAFPSLQFGTPMESRHFKFRLRNTLSKTDA